MLYYVMAKNEQCLGEYRQAEKHLLHAIDILPERIYPYYLLMNLYTEPSYFQPAKLKKAIDSVLTKKPKVESSAIKEMKEKARSMLNNTSIWIQYPYFYSNYDYIVTINTYICEWQIVQTDQSYEYEIL